MTFWVVLLMMAAGGCILSAWDAEEPAYGRWMVGLSLLAVAWILK